VRGAARPLSLAAVVAILGFAAPALAEPVIVVHLRGSGNSVTEAEVILRDADGIVGSCRTTGGTCEITGARPGRATVSARLPQGDETPGRSVLIPPDGKVSLFVAVP
jgi:hypothetical protein